jgi:hypothetical protein
VFSAHTIADSEIVFRPQPGLAWPLTLPYWKATQTGVPLLSWNALYLLFVELGPVFAFCVGFISTRGSLPQRLLLLPFASGFLAAVSIQLGSWPKADMDRFFFFSTQLVFFTAPSWLVPLWQKQSVTRNKVAVAIVFVATLSSGIIYPTWRGATKSRSWWHAWQEQPGTELRVALAKIAPRQMILSDLHMSQKLVDAGFLVVAPMQRNYLNDVDEMAFNDYVKKHQHEANWWFLPANDPRVAARQVQNVAVFEGYVLSESAR